MSETARITSPDQAEKRNCASVEALSPIRILAFALDAPVSGEQEEVMGLTLTGWVMMSKASPAVAIAVERDDVAFPAAMNATQAWVTPLNVPRPDVESHYREKQEALMPGFKMRISLLGMPREFVLLVKAVFMDGSCEPFVRIKVHRAIPPTSVQPNLSPLVLTGLGRTGTTWLMHLLSEHPDIVAYRQYPYETHISNYCSHIAQSFMDTSQFLRRDHQSDFHDSLRRERSHLSVTANIQDPQVARCFEMVYYEQLAGFVCSLTDEFYKKIAANQGQTKARYFVEKYHPASIAGDDTTNIIKEFYPRTREILLVRDFRDLICSVLAFNRKRGFVDFERERFDDDEQYVVHIRKAAWLLLNHWKERQNEIHLLHYEDLVLKPQETLHAVFQYLDLDNSPDVLDGILKRATVNDSDLQYHRTTKSPNESIGRWKTDLSPKLQTHCAEVLKDVLEEFEYGPEGYSSRGTSG